MSQSGTYTSGGGPIATPVSVPNGGTGITSITDHALIVGSGVADVTVLAAATDGQIPIGSTGADPVIGNITSVSGAITVTNGAGTIDLDLAGIIADSFPTDSGTATPAAGVLTVAGGSNINTSGAGSTVTVNLDTVLAGTVSHDFAAGGRIGTATGAGNTLLVQAYDVDGAAYTTFATLTANNTPAMDLDDAVTKASNYIYRAAGTDVPVTDGGTGVSTITDHALVVGSGGGAVTVLAAATDGQFPIGSTGADPVIGNITSTDSSITVTNGAGTIDLASGSAISKSFPTDSGTATPAAGLLTVAGGSNINTSGAGSTVTANLDTALTGTVSHDFAAGGRIGTATVAGNTLLVQAYDVDGTSYTTFATLTANNTPAMDLSDDVTKASSYIYRAGGTDIPVTDGGTGVSTLTDHGVLVGSGASDITPLAVGTDGQLLVGSTGADPVFATMSSTDGTIDITGGAGTIDIDLSANVQLTGIHGWNGSLLETADVTVTAAGGVITLSIEKFGTGNLTAVFSDGFDTWVTAPDTVTLTAGSDTSPTLNYVYYLQSTKTLTASTVGWPATEFAAVAEVLCQSAASLQTDGAYKVHVWTDHVTSPSDQGHISMVSRWIRQQNTTWESGVAQTLTITPNGGAPDNVIFTSSSGLVYQLHEHAFPAFGGTPDVYTVNDSVTPYNVVTDLNALLTDSTGASMSGRYFSLVIWGVVSESTGDCKLMVNLPGGSYSTSSGLTADDQKYADFDIPSDFKGTGFLIYQMNLKHSVAASGTWTSISNIDLRGLFPSVVAGGGTADGTTFPDNVFRIFDEADSTKEIAFEASAITTATTRTITMDDRDIDMDAVPDSFPTDSGTATPAAGVLTASGGTNINTSGAAAAVTVNLDASISAMTAVDFAAGGRIGTATGAGNTLLLQAYDVDGTAYTTFATLTANNTPTMDLDDTVTKASGYIYRAAGTDIPVTDGGTGASTLTDHGIVIGSGVGAVTVLAEASDGQLPIGSTGNDPVLATITAGAGIDVANAAGSITITNTSSGGIAWAEATGATQAMTVNTGYTTNNAAQLDYTLPAVAAIGDISAIAGNSSNGWTLSQNAGQTVHFLGSDTTTGAGGSLTSTTRYDCVEVVCITANTDFTVRNVTGNLTVV